VNEILETCRSCLRPEALLLQLVRSGSHAYGLETPESDEDFRGVFIPAPDDLLGMHHARHVERKEPDIVIKALEEFMRLALEGNPNIIEQLFIDDNNLIYIDEMFGNFRAHRKAFLSTRVRKAYVGYAIGQLKKMRAGHTRDLGAKRKELVDKFGFDTKNCSHTFRLLIQGREIIETGNLSVRLSPGNVEFVRAIRRGEIFKTIDEAQVKADELIANLDAIKSPLPEHPNFALIEKEVIDTQFIFLTR